MHNKGYWRITHANKCYLAHRLAWFFCYGVWPKEIDHIDNNKLNNSIGNLREVTHQLNQLNMPLRSNNTSGVKGVNWDTSQHGRPALRHLTLRCILSP
ncbi:HNH endonuclease [Salmonella enterica subsp. enterica]|nr:HNH endonuclease [Salmonella enterica subsp. enterica]EEJ8550524.1 HNH endonuclease [Salmonella enterica]EGI5248410.1 HNH endonuclease [Salmonella enterica subsp. enterica serovar Brunei]EDQ6067491.1 HNH endonuclease [Salmonella enterica subsp. enterica]EDT7003864.1 HNH endonuclease [Salmonella enterica subsp. enterica]